MSPLSHGDRPRLAGLSAVATTDSVRLALPADVQYLRVARLVASGLGSTNGFDLEAVEDFRIAVSEMCGLMLQLSTGPFVDLIFNIRADGIELAGHTPTALATREGSDVSLFAEEILRVTCDGHTFNVDAGTARFTLFKGISENQTREE